MDLQQKVAKAKAFLQGVSERAPRWSIPDGHLLVLDSDFERNWSNGYASRSVSARIQRSDVNLDDPHQVFVEIRLFLEEDRVAMQAEYGPRWFGKNRRLLTHSTDLHLHETHLPSLLDKVSRRVEYALRLAEFYSPLEVA